MRGECVPERRPAAGVPVETPSAAVVDQDLHTTGLDVETVELINSKVIRCSRAAGGPVKANNPDHRPASEASSSPISSH